MMKSTKNAVECGTLTIVLACAALAGCGGEPGAEGDEELSTRTSALTSTPYVDSTHTVSVEVKVCDWSAVAEHPSAFCTVSANSVLIGGGAEVEGSAPGGGLLYASFPVGKTSWLAISKDQVTPYAHRIRAYAIGLGLANMDQATLASMVTVTQVQSAVSSRPTATVTVPQGHLMLSGGGSVAGNGAGLLLTESYPSSATSWTVSGKDHQIPDTGVATAFVISIPACLNGQWSGGCLVTNTAFATSSVSTGYGMATANTAAGYVPAGVGARAHWSTYGRLLTDSFPTNSVGGAGATVFSKDHNFAEGGATDVWAIGLKGWQIIVP
jgi:hypothetical protein